MYECMYVCMCMNVCMCVCMYVCMYQCVCVRMEGNVLFNDALNTFYLRLYGVGTCVWRQWLRGDHQRGLICPIFYKDKNTNTPCPLGRTPMDRSMCACAARV